MPPHMVTNTLLEPEDEHAPAEPIEHEALIGDEVSESVAQTLPTIATYGDTPFSDDGEEVEHHAVVATEIYKKPVIWSHHDVLQNAVVLVDPRLPDCKQMLESAHKRGLFVTVVIARKPNDGSQNVDYYPTAESLLEIGVHQVYEPPKSQVFDVCECANVLKTLEAQQNLRFLGVIPLREAAVDYSDVLSAMLGLAVHNDLGHASARRDKGLMKLAVANAGLRVAKYARLTDPEGADVPDAIKKLGLEMPVVVKTPRGMGTLDVFICDSMEEAVMRSGEIVRSVGPDGRKTSFSLLEEFLGGDEFAVNIVASPTTFRGVQVTDVWKYNKILSEGTNVNTWQTMVDPHDEMYGALVRYAEGICRAVGIKYGFAHVELKSKYDEKMGKYVDPVMIEVGARLAGGRKAIMAQETVPEWFPFDAMLDAHCGFPVRIPPSFSPRAVARHVFVPSDKNGKLVSVKGDDFQRLKTYNSHIMLCRIGEPVKKAQDIMSFAAFVWLIGSKEDVEADAERARNEFVVEVEDEQ